MLDLDIKASMWEHRDTDDSNRAYATLRLPDRSLHAKNVDIGSSKQLYHSAMDSALRFPAFLKIFDSHNSSKSTAEMDALQGEIFQLYIAQNKTRVEVRAFIKQAYNLDIS
jgi:hypothetical protein